MWSFNGQQGGHLAGDTFQWQYDTRGPSTLKTIPDICLLEVECGVYLKKTVGEICSAYIILHIQIVWTICCTSAQNKLQKYYQKKKTCKRASVKENNGVNNKQFYTEIIQSFCIEWPFYVRTFWGLVSDKTIGTSANIYSILNDIGYATCAYRKYLKCCLVC